MQQNQFNRVKIGSLSLALMALLSHAAQAATISLGALVDGQVTSLSVAIGDQVKKGQVLLEIDPRRAQAQIARLKAQVRLAEAEYKDAKVDFEAEKALFDQTATAKRRFDAAVLNNERSSAKLDALRAQLQEAQVQLDYYVIKSPVDGQIKQLSVQLGDTVFHEHQPLLQIEGK